MEYAYVNGQSLWRWVIAKKEAEKKMKENGNG